MAAALPPNQARCALLIPFISDIFNVRPCLWQLKVAEALLNGDRDVLCVAGTGMGKTLTFWMPLLFRVDGIQVIVTPLNMLGKQNAASLGKAGIRAIAINSETATPANFYVSCCRVSPLHQQTSPHLDRTGQGWTGVPG
ncbi:hypothetical protein PAXRUDRAFT_835209 [Paxillus rubicundulus Ve08.2h10]|uniref:Unplaced genomic scaffold scaffold_2451, whole genome shotgun sequence n=1 Tax=Paxillus rubicundulus Ve08.2h10 TaxID=930991 RepID=A0A0D0CZX1_9AGAM|nr:hypothetical protein PAXRUDRAFT_835209 [Paxillus rubicundulus Ve08.2h10]